jgi:hypothetical protein
MLSTRLRLLALVGVTMVLLLLAPFAATTPSVQAHPLGHSSLPDTFFSKGVRKEKRSYLGQGGEEQNTRSSVQAEKLHLFEGRPQWIHLVYSGRTGMSN